jgi:hypothetical protein
MVFGINAQNTAMVKPMTDNDSMVTKSCYSNIISGGAKYLFNSAKNTRNLLAADGFILDEPAIEYFVKYKDLPKIFFFQQLGTLNASKYASINGLGFKQDLQWKIVNASNLKVAPFLELGLGYYRLTTLSGIENPSIQNVLSGDIRQNTLDNITITGDLGLEIGFGFSFGQRRLMLRGQGGYMTNFPSQWRNAGSIAYNEKLSILSPYAGLSISLDMQCDSGCCK